MTRRDDLAARRAELLARSARLRAEMTAQGRDVAGKIAGVERLAQSARSLAGRPVLLAGAAALFALLAGPRRVFRYAGRALTLVGLAKRLLRLIGSSRS